MNTHTLLNQAARNIDRRFVGRNMQLTTGCGPGHRPRTHAWKVGFDATGSPALVPLCGQGSLEGARRARPTIQPVDCGKCRRGIARAYSHAALAAASAADAADALPGMPVPHMSADGRLEWRLPRQRGST